MNLTPEMIAELRSLERDGNLRTKDVVELAKEPTSALHQHPAFEWDVNKAAFRQWMDAARNIVQVYVGVVDEGSERRTMRQYVHITHGEEQPVYRATQRVLSENRAAIINVVADRILSHIRQYPLTEFDPVIELVEQIRAEAIAPRPRPRRGRPPRRGGRPEARV